MLSVRYSPWMKEDCGAEVRHGIEVQPVHTSPTNKQRENIRSICCLEVHLSPTSNSDDWLSRTSIKVLMWGRSTA